MQGFHGYCSLNIKRNIRKWYFDTVTNRGHNKVAILCIHARRHLADLYEGYLEVSSHFEYLENWSYGFDVIWRPVSGDFTVYPWTLCLGTSQSAVRHRWLSSCVWDRRINNDEQAGQLHNDNALVHSTHLVQAFLFWQNITSPRSVSPPRAHISPSATSGFSRS
jgi:hypothetical protein